MSVGRPPRLRSGRAAVRLFWCFFALYALTASGNPFRVPDEFEVYFQAEHLVDAGDLSVPQTLAIKEHGNPIFFGEFGRDGRPYAPYGPGVAFLIVPFHVAGRAVAAVAGIPRAPLPSGIAWEFVVGGMTSFGMGFAAALAVAGFHRACCALGAAPRRALTLSLVLGCCTMLWPYGKTLYSEAWLAAAFVWAAALLLEPVDAGPAASASKRNVVFAAALVAGAILTKPTAIVIAPAFVVAVLFERGVRPAGRRAAAAALCVAIGAAAAVHVGWNLYRFGAMLDFGYNFAGMVPYPPARLFSPGQLPRGLFVQLLTPGKSLFVWAPILLPSVLVIGTCWRQRRGLAAGLIAGCASALIFYSVYFLPEGGYAHGPRHLLPLVPLLMLPLALPQAALARRTVLVCASIGFVVAACAVTVSFFEDQEEVAGAGGVSYSPYYERIDPGPGEPDVRYRIDYVPFRFALTSGTWMSASRAPGTGPDFFALHLVQARRLFPGGRAIPPWLPWAVSLPWLIVFTIAALSLRRLTP